jgi:glutathione S-transferase
MKLWSSPTSPYARKVKIVLREKAIAFDDLNPSELGVDIGSKNPLAKIPTLELDDGEHLFDSVVIVEYLEALQPVPRMIPIAPLARAIERRWEALADGMADAVVLAMLEGRRSEARRDPRVVERQHDKARAGLRVIETQLATHGSLTPAEFSLADAAVLSALGYCELRAPELLSTGYASIETYRSRFATRPSVKETSPPRS